MSSSSFVHTQSSQISAALTGPLPTSPSNHPPRLHRKRKSIERPNSSPSGGKKRRVDLIDGGGSIYVDWPDGFEGLSPQAPTIPHGFSGGNLNYRSNVQSEYPPSAGRGSSSTAPTMSPIQEIPTPSSTPVKREIHYAYVMSIPQTPMSSSHQPSQLSTPSTSRVVPQPVHRAIDGTNTTLSIIQEASRSTPPRRHGQSFLFDIQNNPPRPPQTIINAIPNTGDPSNDFIDLCSSGDEGTVDEGRRTGGRSSHTQAQGGGSLSSEENDSDYWSICLSDDHREGRVHTPDRVSKVPPTYIQKGWIPPVSSFIITP